MSREIAFTDRRMNATRISRNFLPPPQAIAFRKTRERACKQTQELTLRLDGPTCAALQNMADARGVGIAVLVSMWVRERLAGQAPA